MISAIQRQLSATDGVNRLIATGNSYSTTSIYINSSLYIEQTIHLRENIKYGRL